ncbi:MAG TPA: HD domain-containing protein [Pseudonocardiaceae bacterium]|nr:HD domain-containing protein [Pseudonocardiaceae bacterium]
MPTIPTGSGAAALAEQLLAQLGDRWRHTQAVAARADRLATAVAADDQELLLVAACWHDLGYARELVVTGFHPLDGARFLAREGYPARLCALVAHHSAAMLEAEERGLTDELAAWPREESAVADALWMADMTTGPHGEAVDYPDRLADILSRYEPDSIVGRAMRQARPLIEAAIARTEARLRAASRCAARAGR